MWKLSLQAGALALQDHIYTCPCVIIIILIIKIKIFTEEGLGHSKVLFLRVL